MTSVGELKQAVESVEKEAKRISEHIYAFSIRNRNIISEAADTLKGTSQPIDRLVADSLEDAEMKLSAAKKALDDVADAAKKYGGSL